MENGSSADQQSTALKFFEGADTERLLGTIMALGAEVFVLKAELQRLRMTLASSGLVEEAALEATAASVPFKAWMAKEEASFGPAVFKPFIHPDPAHVVSGLMEGAHPAAPERAR